MRLPLFYDPHPRHPQAGTWFSQFCEKRSKSFEFSVIQSKI
ncbi:MAG: hypothetical protein JWQ02_3134 [Capsulimonas sp.]|jgi:hypothetical protein|nr:hypothetical protein [Capsulimonas sp.]